LKEVNFRTSSTELIHVTDWYPTLLKAAGINDTYYSSLTSDVDGVNQYDYLFGSSESGYRSEMVYNIEGSSKTGVYYGAIRLDGWKLIVNSSQASELYDVLTDEDESTDLSDANPDIVSTMTAYFAVSIKIHIKRLVAL
jgi:arylsulfatase A-like enzyme